MPDRLVPGSPDVSPLLSDSSDGGPSGGAQRDAVGDGGLSFFRFEGATLCRFPGDARFATCPPLGVA